ncbi:UvrD-helicase domain-containing protein [Pseudomonas batumici]|uniref:UvrD-helicase domain-containing protein n=1 Tax=Pseudomonas batumici TaxID=226910 RepID=UPI0030D007E9
MPQVVVPRDFRKMLKALARANRVSKVAAQRAEAACTQASMDGEIRLERTHHGESRMDCDKYDLGDGHRLVVQKYQSGTDDFLIMLFAGTHDDCDSWLKKHKRYKWVRKDSDGKVDFIQVSSLDEPRPSAVIELSFDTPEHVLEEPLLMGFNSEDFSGCKLSAPIIAMLLKVNKGDWGESADAILTEVERQAGFEAALLAVDILTMADRGEMDGVSQRIKVAANAAHETSADELLTAINAPINSETFYTWKEEPGMPDPSNREEWMLYLHPEQTKIASADLSGPSRLRGVSGSGKTCVLVHRARYLARKYNEPILVVTLTESMRKLLDSLVATLCGPERAQIHVATIQGVAREITQDLRGELMRRPSDSYTDVQMHEVIQAVHGYSDGAQGLARLPGPELKNFLRDELSYIRTRMLPSEYDSYATSAFRRTGRGKALGEVARKHVLHGLRAYEASLLEVGSPDHEGVVQQAATLLKDRGEGVSKSRWRAVLADEVQDLSQNEIRMLSLIRTPQGELLKTAADGLFLVGDGAQTIYKRGFSLKTLGISLARASVFKKNYRNTSEILKAAYALISNHEFSDIDEDNQEKPLRPDFAIRRGERPALVRCRSKEAELEHVLAEVTNFREFHGDSALSDICIISRSRIFRNEIMTAMRAANIPCIDIKGNFSIDSEGVRVSTVESAKGFEFGTVFLASTVSETHATPE